MPRNSDTNAVIFHPLLWYAQGMFYLDGSPPDFLAHEGQYISHTDGRPQGPTPPLLVSVPQTASPLAPTIYEAAGESFVYRRGGGGCGRGDGALVAARPCYISSIDESGGCVCSVYWALMEGIRKLS